MMRKHILILTLILLLVAMTGCKLLASGLTGQAIADVADETGLEESDVEQMADDLRNMDQESAERALRNLSENMSDGTAGNVAERLGSECGDGFCAPDEDCSSCEADCGCSDSEICDEGTCTSILCFDDNDCQVGSCQEAQCLYGGTANANCYVEETSTCSSGDGCCPSGCSYENDKDCDEPSGLTSPNTGGSGTVEEREPCGDGRCDYRTEDFNNCPADCFLPACSDGLDNDNDGAIDWADPMFDVVSDNECNSPYDNSEFGFCGNHWCEWGAGENNSNCPDDCRNAIVNYPQCVTDADCEAWAWCGRFGCEPRPQCNNTLDDEPRTGDGLIDFPADPECVNEEDKFEYVWCGDFYCEGNETYLNCPDDCESIEGFCVHDSNCDPGEYCNLETNICGLLPQCNNTLDDDGDGLIDINDPECSWFDGKIYIYDPYDDTEAPVCGDETCEGDENSSNCLVDCPNMLTYQCSDNVDNDDNSLIDFSGGDPECSSSIDWSEGIICSDEQCSAQEDNSSSLLFCPSDCLTGSGITCINDSDCFSWEYCIGNCAMKPACNDGVDNDGDGLTDGADPGCGIGGNYDATGNSEFSSCGDLQCDLSENSVSCSIDCYCGNGYCEPDETSCPTDCA